MAQVSKTVCQEISDLREGQLLALCWRPDVGAVIYFLSGAASVEVSVENAPGERSAGAAEGARGWGWERRHCRAVGFGVLAACPDRDPQIRQGKIPAPTEKRGKSEGSEETMSGAMLEPGPWRGDAPRWFEFAGLF